LIGIAVVFFAILFFVLDTKRDVAYRYSGPGSAACIAQLSNATALVAADNDETSDKLNSEVRSSQAFSCMLQKHSLRAATETQTPTGNPSLTYYLSFLEFKENGEPALYDEKKRPLEIAQMKALLDHLVQQRNAGKQNFVFTFIHGWRHDARIGDENVKNTRLLAAYLTSFLEQRCTQKQRYCNAAVTAVYIGWRGARLNENFIPPHLDDALASLTLFDRKPVSERIAPAVIAALHKIDLTLDRTASADWYKQPRLITIGHSLGGNLLAYGLKEQMVDLVNRKDDFDKPDEQKRPLSSPLGNLVVLLNPASEAENWLAIQRAVHARVGADTASPRVQKAWSDRQPPIYISLTSARSWPANSILHTDLLDIVEAIPKSARLTGQLKARDPKGDNECTKIRLFHSDYRPYYEYDSATYDLFPLYKGDLRPLAQTLEEFAYPDPFLCNDATFPPNTPKVQGQPILPVRLFWRFWADVLRNLPFMNTDVMQTRTIGHLDPVRAPFGNLFSENDPATWYGTTHELLIDYQTPGQPGSGAYKHGETKYADAASFDKSGCAVVDNWLTTARHTQGTPKSYGVVNWDSRKSAHSYLTPVRIGPDEAILGQIRQTLFFSGMRSITGANDPFWNMRAYQTAMTGHNGFVSYPLICSIFQFVMDDITGKPAEAPAH
jgi:hypothetical protein